LYLSASFVTLNYKVYVCFSLGQVQLCLGTALLYINNGTPSFWSMSNDSQFKRKPNSGQFITGKSYLMWEDFVDKKRSAFLFRISIDRSLNVRKKMFNNFLIMIRQIKGKDFCKMWLFWWTQIWIKLLGFILIHSIYWIRMSSILFKCIRINLLSNEYF